MFPIFIPICIPARRGERRRKREEEEEDSIFSSDLYKSFSGECAPRSGASVNASGQSIPASSQSKSTSDMLEILWLTNNPPQTK